MMSEYAISTTTAISGNITYTLLSTTSPVVVKGARIQQSKDLSTTFLYCPDENNHTVAIAKNYAKDYPQDILNFKCFGNISIVKTGNDEAFVSLTYQQPYIEPIVSTNTQAFINGFSYGEIIIGFFVLVLCANAFFGGILDRLIGKKQKLGYRIKL